MITESGSQSLGAIIFWCFLAAIIALPIACFVLRFCYDILKGRIK